MIASTLTINRLSLPARIESATEIRGLFTTFLATLPFDRANRDTWELLLAEGINNAIIHGARLDPRKTVSVEWWIEEDSLCLAIEDPGQGPPSLLSDNPALPDDPLSVSGRGLFLISSLSDRQRHFRCADGYRIVIAKRHPSLVGTIPPNPEVERIIEELSTSYESLSAFYRLGENLLRHDSLAVFLKQTLDDVLLSHGYDRLGLVLHPTVPEAVRQAVLESRYYWPDSAAHPLLADVFEKQSEWVWSGHPTLPTSLTGQACACAIPVRALDQVWAALVAGRSNGHLTTADLQNLRTFADLTGLALAQMYLREMRDKEQQGLKEMEIAAAIQKSLLTLRPPPFSPRWEILLRQHSAREVGGDFADASIDSEGRLFMAIIDVMGKGVSAALLASIFRAVLKTQLNVASSLPQKADAINRILCAELGELVMFVTCVLARFDPATSLLEVVNSGHCPVLFLSADGLWQEIDPSGPPLGIFPEIQYQMWSRLAQPGEALVLVTDGLYEWKCGGEIFGWPRLRDMAARLRSESPEVWWNDLQSLIAANSGAGPRLDDETLLVWRLLS